jgi:hypothetical protein
VTAICRLNYAAGTKARGCQLQQIVDNHTYNRGRYEEQPTTNNRADLVKTVAQNSDQKANQLQHANFITGRRHSPRSNK